jgi:hypothetical protein
MNGNYITSRGLGIEAHWYISGEHLNKYSNPPRIYISPSALLCWKPFKISSRPPVSEYVGDCNPGPLTL